MSAASDFRKGVLSFFQAESLGFGYQSILMSPLFRDANANGSADKKFLVIKDSERF